MSAAWGVGGAILLGAATLPQAIRLARTRSARDFHVAFALLNLGGLVLLSMRSAELGEVAFLAINVIGALFWAGVLVVKLHESPGVMNIGAKSHKTDS